MTRVETLTLLAFYIAMMLLASSLAGCAAPKHPHVCGAGMTCMSEGQ